jgi:D-alanyl-D-alanine carboxypeptidase
LSTEKAAEQITARFRKLAQSDRKIINAYLLVHTEDHGLHLNLAHGEGTDPGQPVFMASVGKLFAAALVGQLVDQGELSFDDRLADHLDQDLLRGLHIYKGTDYTGEIRIKHLLNHTSGLHDYFEDKPAQGKGMLWRILNEPERQWSPREVVAWSKQHLKPHFPPGKGFHYSDTGYHLAGLVVEAVTGQPFHAALHSRIFEPLGMQHAFLLGHSQPLQPCPHPVAGLYYGQQNVIGYPSLSIDYAGGGVTAPLEDLLIFTRALAQGRVVQPATLEQMRADTARFSVGIDYGYGIMKITTVPLIMPARFNCWGNAGSTGAFLFYHPTLDAHIIGSLNQFGYPAKGIRFMMAVIGDCLKYLDQPNLKR